MPAISRREWLWATAWAVVILIITSLPYLYGAAMSTPTQQFGGFVIGVEDGHSYLAKMRLGAAGSWRFHLFYTSEPHDGAYVYLFYLLLGKIARLGGGSFILVYHLARVASGFVLLLTVYYVGAFFTTVRPVRRLALLLVGVGSGLGWLVVLTGWAESVGLPLDFYAPEAFAFHMLFGLPHLSLAVALLLWAILFMLLAWERRQWRYALYSGLVLLGMAIIAAFYGAVFAVVIGVAALLRLWRRALSTKPAQNNRWWLELSMAAAAVAISMPVVFYNAYVFAVNPIFNVWAAQNHILSPAPWHYLLAFGLLAALAAVGGWQEWRRGAERSLLLIGWCVVVPILVYIPFNLQRRLMVGVQVPLSILAAMGLWQLYHIGKSAQAGEAAAVSRGWRLGSLGLVILFSLSNIMILGGAFLTLSRPSPPLFQTDTLVQAADWLGRHTTEHEVVLAAYETGNYLPTRMPARVFVGHGPETAYSDKKRAMVMQFFTSHNDNFRRNLLQKYGITHLFYGAAERALGEYPPDTAPYLEELYDNGQVQIYRIDRNVLGGDQ